MPLRLFRLRNLATANVVGVLWAAAMFAWFFLSAKIVMRSGIGRPLGVGLVLAATGLLLFARAPVGGHFIADVLPSMVLLGVGAGLAFNPVLLAAMGDVDQSESGLASGIVDTSFMMGGALGLAVLASVAASRTSNLASSGHSRLSALAGGYHTAFLIGAAFALVAVLIGTTLLRPAAMPAEPRTRAPSSDAALAEISA